MKKANDCRSRYGREKALVYVVRHGETEWNVADRQQGHLDSSLTEVGIKQVGLLADSLRGHGIQALNSFSITGNEWRLETWGSTTHLQDLRSLDECLSRTDSRK